MISIHQVQIPAEYSMCLLLSQFQDISNNAIQQLSISGTTIPQTGDQGFTYNNMWMREILEKLDFLLKLFNVGLFRTIKNPEERIRQQLNQKLIISKIQIHNSLSDVFKPLRFNITTFHLTQLSQKHLLLHNVSCYKQTN